MREEPLAVSACIGRICIGEMAADVAERRRAQERVHDGVQQNVGIAVAEQALLIRDIDAAEDELSALHEAVDIISHAETRHARSPLPSGTRMSSDSWRAFQNDSAMMRSPGVVILMFS